MKEVRFGIIGTGMMGTEHMRNVLALDGAVITAVSDPNDEPLQWARWTLGDEHAPVAEYRDHNELIASGLCDAVIVASPNFTHVDVLADVLRSDLAVLVEKPLCTTVADCLRVRSWSEQRDALTWVGLEYRYMPPVRILLEQIAAGATGQLKMLAIREHRFPFLTKVANWNRFNRNTGGTLVEKCCHFFDLMNLAMRTCQPDDRPQRVYASGGQDENHLDELYDGEVPDILDNAFVIVDYASGARAALDLCMFAEVGRNEQELVATGPAGKIEAFVPGPGHVYVGNRLDREVRKVEVTDDPRVAYRGAHHGASFLEVADFADAVRSGTEPGVTVDDGLWAVAVGEAAHRSIEEARPVRLEELGLPT
jgi:myo-inositol 2-dehydrogenase / D-chiro-inositol 1-dehydrogenase